MDKCSHTLQMTKVWIIFFLTYFFFKKFKTDSGAGFDFLGEQEVGFILMMT